MRDFKCDTCNTPVSYDKVRKWMFDSNRKRILCDKCEKDPKNNK